MILQLHRSNRHDSGNGMFVYELDLAIPAKQYAKIVEPGDIALQFHTVHEVDRDRGLALAD